VLTTTRRTRPGNARLAVAYLRVSTEDQKLGPEAQRAAIEPWAAREGVQVAAWHVDALVREHPHLTRAGSRARLDRYVRALDAPESTEEAPAHKPDETR